MNKELTLDYFNYFSTAMVEAASGDKSRFDVPIEHFRKILSDQEANEEQLLAVLLAVLCVQAVGSMTFIGEWHKVRKKEDDMAVSEILGKDASGMTRDEQIAAIKDALQLSPTLDSMLDDFFGTKFGKT